MSFDDSFESASVELVDDNTEFFTPVAFDVIDRLLGQYQGELEKIKKIAEVCTSIEYRGAMGYFMAASAASERTVCLNVDAVFNVEKAVFCLDARYWGEALALTDVYDCMPQARRDVWNAQLRGEKYLGGGQHRFQNEKDKLDALPHFTEDTVRGTLTDLLRMRAVFFSERIDGIFQGLSSDHVTNVPEGFSRRMIVGGMLSYSMIEHRKAGLIGDLRAVVAKFMGRDEPKYSSNDVLLRELYKQTGQWVEIDGGTLRIRVYKKGTAHIEVHPDMAWRLNQVLAQLYPLAIPASFRTKPKTKAKEFQMMGRPLPFATLDLLSDGLCRRARGAAVNEFCFGFKAKEHKATYADASNVLAALGGVLDPNRQGVFVFDYPVDGVIKSVIISGCLPDQKAHQYYPTPERLAKIAVDMADIVKSDAVLEPSAGQGGIADHLPKKQTTCIEISALHCEVLKAKGYKTKQADFLTAPTKPYDVVVMNPPFSEGRWLLHVEHAAAMLTSCGRLVAILPASAKGKKLLDDSFTCEWSNVFEREFSGTSVSVVLLKAVRLA